MSTACVEEVHSYMSHKCHQTNQLTSLHSCRDLNDPKMAPLVEQDKNSGNGDLIAEHPNEQFASIGTNSSENDSKIQSDNENNAIKLKNLPLNDSPPNLNGSLSYEPSILHATEYFRRMVELERRFGVSNEVHNSADSSMAGGENLLFDGIYRCHKCNFVGRNDDELHGHALTHDPFECSICGYLAETPDNLKMHLGDEHPEISETQWDDHIIFHENDLPLSPSPKKKSKLKSFEDNIDKPRKTPCKLCHNFVGNSKGEYYEHLLAMHKDSGKLLPCSMCRFIALYKHHLEYHFRNHFGSRPYKCETCGYKCVNRSMLNSHHKSHSNVYQYSCENCSYMTKYLHSLKMHLRKYNHQPGRVLNPDGSVNSNTIIDVHGKRRGPKSKKRKSEVDQKQEGRESPKSKSSPSPPVSSFNPHPPQNIRILYNPQIHNNYTGNLYVRPGPSEAFNYMLPSPPNVNHMSPSGPKISHIPPSGPKISHVPTFQPNITHMPFRCIHCEFVADNLDMYNYHIYHHMAQDPSNPMYPHFLRQPHCFSSLGFGPHFNTESLSKNIRNQSTTVERRNINESLNMDPVEKDVQLQNSTNGMYNYVPMENNLVNKRESPLAGMAVLPGGQQQSRQKYRKRKDRKSATPSPNATLTIKEEIPEAMNGIGDPFEKISTDNAPLDLSVKQPSSPEMKSNGASIAYSSSSSTYSPPSTAVSPVSSMLWMPRDRVQSVSPKFGNGESKVNTQKTNRRKGRAFKLNQYMIESEPVSDGFETEIEKLKAICSPHLNGSYAESVIASEIKKKISLSYFQGRKPHKL